MPFQIIRDDIAKVRADVIVNSANPKPVCGGGAERAIFEAAGYDDMLAARQKIGAISPGEAAVTRAFKLHARYVIHTVGPVWQGGDHREIETLASCYRKCLLLAQQLKVKSIAFPMISTGVYGFPKDKALETALDVIRWFLEIEDMEITLVVFDMTSYDVSSIFPKEMPQFIDDAYVEASHAKERREYFGNRPRPRPRQSWDDDMFVGAPLPAMMPKESAEASGYAAPSHKVPNNYVAASKPAAPFISNEETFQERLLHLIDKRGMTDVEIYKKANLDRKLFSKIRCNRDYMPKKKTALALAAALELDRAETVDLLSRAGLALSPSSRADQIFTYCIENRIYDIFKINALLFEYDEPLLGY